MDLDWLGDRELEEWIMQSLRSIREAADAGLDDEEAIRRAKEFDTLILAGRISPADIKVDKEFKDVFYALVYRLLDVPGRTPEKVVRHAMAVYEFIDGTRWDDDDFCEKQELLKDCAAAGTGHQYDDTREAGSPETPCYSLFGVDSEAAGDSPPADVQRFFDRALPAIHTILVELHQLVESDARRLETDLLVWFVRFCRRSGTLPDDSRALLLAAGSQFARQYRLFRDGSVESQEEARLGRLIQRAFSELARERASSGKRGTGN